MLEVAMAGKSNLFSIDVNAVLRAISEANDSLVKRHSALMEAFHRVPTDLQTDDDIQRAKRFAEQLKESAGRCRSTRLADAKPLMALLKRVEAFFKTMETEANTARDAILASISEAGRRRAIETRRSHAPALPKPAPEAVMINRQTGEVLGTALPLSAISAATDIEIPLAWHIDGVDRDAVDLEALRPFFTDLALLTAARGHLRAHGPHGLRGVTYVEKFSPR